MLLIFNSCYNIWYLITIMCSRIKDVTFNLQQTKEEYMKNPSEKLQKQVKKQIPPLTATLIFLQLFPY